MVDIYRLQFSSTDSYSVGSTKHTTSICTAIADTSTTLLYLPSSVVQSYYNAVEGATNNATAGIYIFPSSADLPSFSITVGDASHTIPGRYMNYAPYTDDMCFGGIQDNTGMGYSISGDVFHKSQFVVFDVGYNRLGFAKQASS